MKVKTTVPALVLCAGMPVCAQVNEPDLGAATDRVLAPHTGTQQEVLGDFIAGPYSVDMGNPAELGQLGVDHAWSHFWVSARGNWAGGRVGNWVAKYTEDGTFVKDFDQGSASAWGYRDGASDEAAGLLYFGWDDGGFAVHEYDCVTGDISLLRAYTVNVPQTLHALARTPRNTFITTSYPSGSLIYEFDVAGNQIISWPNPGIEGYGCTFDATTETYWWTDIANNGVVMETNAGMNPTGRTWNGLSGFTAYAVAGGLDLYAEPRSRSGSAFVFLAQGGPDEISIFEADLGSSAHNSNGNPCLCPCACDFGTNGPGVCDVFDFLAFQAAFTKSELCACNIDISTGSGVCDIFDFLAFQNDFVAGCP